jgi:arsenate reductase (glutaredoxin)
MMTIYHNPRCSKSRAGLKYLEENNIEHKVHLYLQDHLSVEELSTLLKQTGLDAVDLVRKQEDYYKKELKGKEFTTEKWLQILAENPKLLQRPIVQKDHKAVLAQPPEKIDELK